MPLEYFSTFFPTYRVFSQLESRIFGSVAFVHVPSQRRSKLDPRSRKCVFLGYYATQKDYGVIVPKKGNIIPPLMLLFLKIRHFIPEICLRGRVGVIQISGNNLKYAMMRFLFQIQI